MADTVGSAELGALLLRQMADLLGSLDDEQVAGLLAGGLRLAVVPAAIVVPVATVVPEATAPSPDTARDSSRRAGFEALPAGVGRSKAARPRVSRSRGAAADVISGTGGGSGRRGAELPASVDVEAIRAALDTASSREDADAAVGQAKLTVGQLRALGAALGVEGITGRDAKAAVVRKIVDGTAGVRLRSAAMYGGERGT